METSNAVTSKKPNPNNRINDVWALGAIACGIYVTFIDGEYVIFSDILLSDSLLSNQFAP
jgi:hypothetical protein